MGRFPRRGRMSFRNVMHAVCRRCRGPLWRGVRRTRADRYVKRHRSVDFALALVSYFLLGLSSLRALKRRLDQDELVGRCVGWRGMSISQLSKTLHARPPQLWEPLIKDLALQVRGSQVPSWVRVIDSTLFKLSAKLLTRCTGKRFKNPGNAGIHTTMVLEVENLTPVQLRSKLGQGSDAANGRAVLPPEEDIEGHLYLFDRGFRNYAFYEDLIERQADFVTRQSETIRYEMLHRLKLDRKHPQVVSDEKVRLGSQNARNQMKNPVRRIVLETEDGSCIFLSSCFRLSAFEVTELYRQRWIIEVFFRWLKKVIGCSKPLGYSQRAAEHTIYAALVVYLFTLLLTGLASEPPKDQKTAQIKAAFELLCALLYQTPRRQNLQALGFA